MASPADTVTFPPPVNPSDPGRGPLIMGVTWMFTSLSMVVVAARFYVRTRPPNRLSPDDWMMAFSMVCNIVAQSCITVAYHYGLGKHDADLWYNPQLINILKYSWIQVPFSVSASISARYSITYVLIRIFNRVRWLKTHYIVLAILMTIGGILIVATIFLQVSPLEGLWDPALPARRWDPRIEVYTTYTAGSLYAYSDISYTIFPILIIRRLQMPLRKKLSLVFILGLSIFTCAAAVMKVVTAHEASTLGTDAQYHSAMAFPWDFAEQGLVIILGSAPVFGTQIMNIDFSAFQVLVARLSHWSNKLHIFTSIQSSTSAERKTESHSPTPNNGSDVSANHLDDKTISRANEYSVI